MSEEASPGKVIVRALPLHVPEARFQNEAEKKRVKRGIIGESEELMVFGRILLLPYLNFAYKFPAEKGFLSKQTVVSQGRSVVMALREADFGFDPELSRLVPLLSDEKSDAGAIIEGVGSTILVDERLDELRRILSDYDKQLEALSMRYDSLPKADHAKQDLKDSIDHLKRTRDMRWKMFADGLKLPAKIDLEKLELLEGNLFYMPYFIARFTRGGESRFLVWDREGKENDIIAEELMRNGRFRELVLSHSNTRPMED